MDEKRLLKESSVRPHQPTRLKVHGKQIRLRYAYTAQPPMLIHIQYMAHSP